MNGDARRLANRHQARHDRVGIVRGRADNLGLNRRRDAAHDVMDGRDHRDRLLVRIDAGEDASRLDDAGQSLVEDIRCQVLEMQVDVIFLLADAAPLADLDRLGSADHVARGEVLLARRIFGHEPVPFAVGQVTTLAASALRNQNAGAIYAGRVELDEFHVLQWQPRAQHHGVAVTGTGVSRGAGLVDPTAAASGDDGHIGAEPMNRPVLETPSEQTAARAILVHQEVHGEILDKEACLVLEALLIERVQDGVAGPIRGGAGPIRHVALGIICRVSTKAALVDLALVGTAERHTQMLEFHDSGDRLTAHEFDRVLVTEPVGAPDCVEHVPAPVVPFHVAERRADATLRGNRVAACREDLGDAGSVQPRRDHAQCRAQSGAAGAEDDHVERVVDDVVAVGHDGLPYRPRKSLRTASTLAPPSTTAAPRTSSPAETSRARVCT